MISFQTFLKYTSLQEDMKLFKNVKIVLNCLKKINLIQYIEFKYNADSYDLFTCLKI